MARAVKLQSRLKNTSLGKDKAFVLQLVKEAGHELEFADTSLKRDRDIVLAAVNWGAYAFRFADEALKSDRSFILEAAKSKDFRGKSECQKKCCEWREVFDQRSPK